MKKMFLLISAFMILFVGCSAINGQPEHTPPAISTEPSTSPSSSAATAIPTAKPVAKPPVQPQTQSAKKTDHTRHDHHVVLTLQWNPVPGASWYNLYYDTKPGVTKKSHKKTTRITTTTHTVTGLSPNTTYYFVVTAANATTESAESSEISGKTKKK